MTSLGNPKNKTVSHNINIFAPQISSTNFTNVSNFNSMSKFTNAPYLGNYSLNNFCNDKHFKCNCCQPRMINNVSRRIKVIMPVVCDHSKEKYGMLFYDIDNDMICFQKKSGCIVSLAFTTQEFCNEPCFNHPIKEIIKEVRKEIIVEKGIKGDQGDPGEKGDTGVCNCKCGMIDFDMFAKVGDVSNLATQLSFQMAGMNNFPNNSNNNNSNNNSNNNINSLSENAIASMIDARVSSILPAKLQYYLSNKLLVDKISDKQSNLPTASNKLTDRLQADLLSRSIDNIPSRTIQPIDKSFYTSKYGDISSLDELTPVCPPCETEHSENDNFLSDTFLKECLAVCDKVNPELAGNKTLVGNKTNVTAAAAAAAALSNSDVDKQGLIVYKNNWTSDIIYQENHIIRDDDNNLYLCKKQHVSKTVNRPTNDKRYIFWEPFGNTVIKQNVFCQLFLEDVSYIKINAGKNNYSEKFTLPIRLKVNNHPDNFQYDSKTFQTTLLKPGDYRITYNIAYQGAFNNIKMMLLSGDKELKQSVHKNICEIDDLNYINHTFILTVEGETNLELAGYAYNKSTSVVSSNLIIQTETTWLSIERIN